MVNYNEIRTTLIQKQGVLARQKVRVPKSLLNTGIQGLPQRKEIATFNRRLKEQSRMYDKQISDIDKFLLTREENQRKKAMIKGKGKPTQTINPEPNITQLKNPSLKRLRNRFRKGGSWF